MPSPDKRLSETASQTAGPFVHIGLAPAAASLGLPDAGLGAVIAPSEAPGERIAIEGTVRDGTGALVKDALIEIWQADAMGQFHNKPDPVTGFRGWGRRVTDFETGAFRIETIKPGKVAIQGAQFMAPHLCLWLVARGINCGLHTRLYFDDEKAANNVDPVLSGIDTHRRNTLIAKKSDSAYRFDIVLQGKDETVFFDV